MTLTHEQIAEICHEANRAIQRIGGDPTPSLPWADVSAHERESAVEGVANVSAEISMALTAIAQGGSGVEADLWYHLAGIWTKTTITTYNNAQAERLHEMWMAALERDGWKLGKIKDPVAKTHPCLIPYRDLSYTQRVKDSVFVAVVRACLGVVE